MLMTEKFHIYQIELKNHTRQTEHITDQLNGNIRTEKLCCIKEPTETETMKKCNFSCFFFTSDSFKNFANFFNFLQSLNQNSCSYPLAERWKRIKLYINSLSFRLRSWQFNFWTVWWNIWENARWCQQIEKNRKRFTPLTTKYA